MLLRLLLLVVCSGIARGDNATNSTNGTYVGDDIDCTRYEDTPMVYMVASPLWLLLLIYWAYSIHVKHAQYANDMHRMLVWVPAVQAMQGALSIGYFNACPWESNVSMLLATLWVVITIIKDPVILFCLLMVAKGWCVTRAALSPNEVFSASVIASLMYISIISMYAMAMADANKVLSMMPTLVTYAVMLWHVMTAISFNLRILKAQLFALRRFNVDATTTPVFTKYKMFSSLYWYSGCYFTVDLALFVGGVATDVPHKCILPVARHLVANINPSESPPHCL